MLPRRRDDLRPVGVRPRPPPLAPSVIEEKSHEQIKSTMGELRATPFMESYIFSYIPQRFC